jgi:hypothetical protein
MDALTNELSEVKAAIKKVEGQIDRVEAELLATTDEKEKEYLREEKKSLREEKKSLREKENLLLRKMDFTPSEVPSSTPSMFFCLLSLIPDCCPCLIPVVVSVAAIYQQFWDAIRTGKVLARSTSGQAIELKVCVGIFTHTATVLHSLT